MTVLSGEVRVGDVRERLRDVAEESVQTVVTSPPYYGLRNYGVDGQIGLEESVGDYVAELVEVFREVRRVLRRDGTLWLNLGDTYNQCSRVRSSAQVRFEEWGGAHAKSRGGSRRYPPADNPERLKMKDLCMVPFRVAIALQEDGWYLRSVMPWIKGSVLPEPVTDRPSTATEYWFLLAKSKQYYADMDAIRVDHQRSSLTRANGSRSGKDKFAEGAPGQGAHTIMKDPGGSCHPSGRNRRNTDTFFDSVRLLRDECDRILSEKGSGPVRLGQGTIAALYVNPKPFSGSHFATFPPKIVKPLILCSTSAAGECPSCGAPWGRITDRIGCGGFATGKSAEKRSMGLHTALGSYDRPRPIVTTTGWQPTCTCCPNTVFHENVREGVESDHSACDACTPVPQTVLDPFFGAGTVGLVAGRLGRRWVGVELNPDYAELARERIAADTGENRVSGSRHNDENTLDLFSPEGATDRPLAEKLGQIAARAHPEAWDAIPPSTDLDSHLYGDGSRGEGELAALDNGSQNVVVPDEE